MNPQALALTKAIKQQESGGKYDQVGGSEEYGAYQWIPSTWKAHAKEVLGDENADIKNPTNQNKVAYTIVEKDLKSGLTPAQIAAKWNSGSPTGWENKKGVNKFGVKYDVPAYVNAVGKYYTQELQKTKKPSETPSLAQSESKVKGGLIGDLLTGSTQKFGRTIGESLASRKNTELYTQALEGNTEIANNLRTRIAENKKIGKDTSRLESALEQLVKDTPQQEQFTGSVINKTAGQVIGEAGGTALEALSGGLLGSGVKTVASKTLPILGKVKQGAKIGALYGGLGGTTSALQEEGGVADVASSGVKGALVGGALGGALSAVGGKLENKLIGRASELGKRKENVTGQILQGTSEDIPKGQKVFSKIETKGVKTYKDLGNKLEKKVEDLSAKQDRLLDKDLSRKKLGDLKATLKVGEKEIKYNYVKDALDQLKDYYTKTNNQIKRFEITQLERKAAREGLTNKEINEIAKLHGRELSAFNVNGQLASGLTKQAAENTRAGVKRTVRELSGDKKSKVIDQEIASTIRIKDLIQKQAEEVNKLQQKIQEYGLGEKIGRLIFQAFDLASLGSLKGAVAASLPRGVGYKTLNALDLESKLQKNLKTLEKLTDKKLSASNFLETLDKLLNQRVNLVNQSSNSGKSQVSSLKIPSKTTQPIQISNNTSIKKLPSRPPKLGKK